MRLAQKMGLIGESVILKALSKRERECLKLMLRGMTAPQIGDALGISKRTVFDYLNHAKYKLGCFSKYELFQVLLESEKLNILS